MKLLTELDKTYKLAEGRMVPVRMGQQDYYFDLDTLEVDDISAFGITFNVRVNGRGLFSPSGFALTLTGILDPKTDKLTFLPIKSVHDIKMGPRPPGMDATEELRDLIRDVHDLARAPLDDLKAAVKNEAA